MANVAPGRRPRGHHAPVKPARVMLTALVDSLLILLVFLIKSLDAEGALFTTTAGLQLPISSAHKWPAPSLVVTVARENILLEGRPVALVQECLSSPDLIIPGLAAVLQKKKELTEYIAARSSLARFQGEVTIAADLNSNYTLLRKVLYTCSQTGYSRFNFAVMVN